MVPSRMYLWKMKKTGKERCRFTYGRFKKLKPVFEEEWTCYRSTFPYPDNKIEEWTRNKLELCWYPITPPRFLKFIDSVFVPE